MNASSRKICSSVVIVDIAKGTLTISVHIPLILILPLMYIPHHISRPTHPSIIAHDPSP